MAPFMQYGGDGLDAKSCLTLASPWTVVHQAPLSMGSSRQEYWTGLPFPTPGDLPDPGIESKSPIASGFFTTEPSFMQYGLPHFPIIHVIFSLAELYKWENYR